MNLLEILQQPGHSGIIEGNCRVLFKELSDFKEFSSVNDFLYGENSPGNFRMSFSYGIQPLGTYKVNVGALSDIDFLAVIKKQ